MGLGSPTLFLDVGSKKEGDERVSAPSSTRTRPLEHDGAVVNVQCMDGPCKGQTVFVPCEEATPGHRFVVVKRWPSAPSPHVDTHVYELSEVPHQAFWAEGDARTE